MQWSSTVPDPAGMPSPDRSLRVALVGPGFPPQLGGIETHLAKLADGLAASGCEVDVLVQQGHQDALVPPVEHLRSGVTVRRFRSRTHSRRFPVAPSLIPFLLSNSSRYDVVHGHSFHAVPASLAAFLTKGPFVFTPHYHGGGHTQAARVLHQFYRPVGAGTFRRAQVFIANSRHEAALLTADFPLIEPNLHVVYPGVDVDEILAAKPYPTDRRVILTGGRLEEYKQVDIALRALPLLPKEVHLVILGEGPALPRLRELTVELGAESQVTFLGRIDTPSVRRWQRTAAVGLSLSRHEAFGLTLLEGLVGGAQVVATDIPASREVASILPRGTLFVPVTPSPDEVAAAIRQQLDATPAGSGLDAVPTWPNLTLACLDLYVEAMRAHDRRGVVLR